MPVDKLVALLALILFACTAPPEKGPAGSAPTVSSEAGAAAPASEAIDGQDPVLATLVVRLAEAEQALEERSFADARDRIAKAIDQALEELATREDPAAVGTLERMARLALHLEEMRSAEEAWRRVLEVRSRTLPEGHPDLQNARGQLASTLYRRGDLEGARALEELVVDVCSRTLPEEHPALQQARMNLAVTLDSLGDLQGARALHESVVEVRSRTLSEDDPDLQISRMNLAATMFSLGDLPGARELFERVSEVYERTLPEEAIERQKVKLNLAATLLELGDLEGARVLEEEILDVFSRTLPEEHTLIQTVRLNHAATVERLGDLHAARAMKEKVVEVWSRALHADDARLQAARGNLAITLRKLGDLEGARTFGEQVLEVSARTLPDDHPDLQAARLNLANTLGTLGDLQAERVLEERVLEIRSRTLPDDHPDLQVVRGNLAVTIADLGDREGARALHEQVLEAFSRTLPDDHPDLQVARQNLATVLHQLGDHSAERALDEKVLEVSVATLPDDHPDLQAARSNYAIAIKEHGDLHGAKALEELVLETYSRSLPDDHPSLQLARMSLAETLAELGDLETAQVHFERVLEVRSKSLPDEHPLVQSARHNLVEAIGLGIARSLEDPGASSGEREIARARCIELLLADCRSRTSAARQALLESSPREAEARCESLLVGLDAALSWATGFGVHRPSPELARSCFVLSETTRGSALGSARRMRQAESTPRSVELRDQLKAASEDLARLAASGTTSEEFHRALTRRETIERELVALAGDPSSGAPVPDLEFDVDALAAELRSDHALVTYRRFKRKSPEPSGSSVHSLCAFVLRRGENPSPASLALVDLGPITPIESVVRIWREGLGATDGRGVGVGARSAVPDSTNEGHDLRRLVLDPLAGELAGASRVVLVLDDVLHLVPFDALPQRGSPPELVGDRLRIETRATLTELLGAEPQLSGPGKLLAVGGVAFDTGRASVDEPIPDREPPGILRGGTFAGFGPLPATGTEVDALAASFAEQFGSAENVSILRGVDATRDRLEELAPGARWLHVATHGWFAPESVESWEDLEALDRHTGLGLRLSGEDQVRGMSPMSLCGLALAGANMPEDDFGRAPGLVTAQEISALDLSRCELAVLSACDTNVGIRRAGQGVASLQKALQMAGARSVITSLWKVPDEATGELMTEFYRRLWVEKQPRWQALWEAKRKLRAAKDESGEPRYSTRDWAAWVLTGETD